MKEFDREEIRKKIEDAKKDMKRKGRNYDGLGEAIEKLNKENGEDFNGVILGPKDDLTFRRVLKEIKDLDNDDEK